MKYQLLLLILISNIFYTNSINAQDLPFSYTHYPPHTYDVNGDAAGKVVDNIIAISNKAGISITWEYRPMLGIVKILDRGDRIMCESGRVYTKERAEKWQFIPYKLAQVPREIIITSKNNLRKINAHKSISSLLEDKELFGLMAQGLAYNTELREALKNKNPQLGKIAYTDAHLLLLVQKDRIHYTVSTQEQLDEAQKENPSLSELVTTQLEGQMDAENLYVVCTKATPSNMVNKLSHAMQELGYKKGPEIP